MKKLSKSDLLMFVVLFMFATAAFAENVFSTLSLPLGTAAVGVNWTIPDKTAEFRIQTAASNWIDMTYYQGSGINWSNSFRIQSGTSYSMSNTWSQGNSVGLRGQIDNVVAQIQYSTSK